MARRGTHPELDALFPLVGRALRGALAGRQWLFLAQAALPVTVLVLVAALGAESSAFAGVAAVLVPLAWVALLAWGLRACHGVFHPGAEGRGVALWRHGWRVAAALAVTAGPPLVLLWFGVFQLVVMLPVLVAALCFGALTGAQVAATGEWRPLPLWQVLAGRRMAALGLMLPAALIAWVAMPVGFLIALTIAGSGAGSGAPGAMVAGAVLMLGGLAAQTLILAAFATAIYERLVSAPVSSLA
jgi:hypothetical protein